ncbi:MAG TPA: NAD(P)-binding domain-containing protein [Stellaceae bacterium]|nr:NAD(P)-binding domain-containing protein [Stellaceae bacterium]
MEDRRDRMAVIGAGPVGLGIARALKARGIAYDQLEADDDVGGNWYHGVYHTAHIISSRRTTEFTEFPMPGDYPDFPSRVQMLQYLRDYARHFDLRRHIEFGAKVVLARPRGDELWEVALAGGRQRLYKGLLVCNGHHWSKRSPDYSGRFAGTLIHSKDYKSPEQLAGRRVLVVGGGNSACDVASEAARVGASCDLSLRRGYWFLPKTLLGRPLVEALPLWLPVPLQRLLLKAALKVVFGDYRRYGLPRPDHKIFEHHPTINSELLHYVKHGRIRPRPDIKRFDGERVHFVDGSSGVYDIVVCATGYHVDFPFLPKGLVPVTGGLAHLYGGALLPEYRHLYIIGTMQPRYGFGPLLSEGAELVATMIELQEKMVLPLGRVLKEVGQKPPQTHLINPAAALRQMRRARKLMPLLLPRAERKLRRRVLRETPPLAGDAPLAWPNADLQVY